MDIIVLSIAPITKQVIDNDRGSEMLSPVFLSSIPFLCKLRVHI